MNNDQPLVSIIIVTLSARDFLEDCLRSIKESSYRNYEIVYVDNASKDGSLALVQEKFPEVKIVRNRKNLGFSGGNNAGLEFADGEIIFLLNDDTIIHPELIEVLVGELTSSDKVGIVGPKIYFLDPKDALSAKGEIPRLRPDLSRGFARNDKTLAQDDDVIWFAGGEIDWSRGENSHRGRDLTDQELGHDLKREVDFITGCALMVKKEVIKKIGLLDRKFFAYWEDADWCQKAKKAGYRVVYVPFGGVWHLKSATAGFIFMGDLKAQLKGANFFKKILIYFKMAGRYFYMSNHLKHCNWRNRFVFFMRHAPARKKPKIILKFILRDTPKFLWSVVLSLFKVMRRPFL